MIFTTTSVRGFWLNQWRRGTAPEKKQAVIEKVLAAMASGEVVPPVEAEYALADFADAIRHTKQPGRRGKILLVG
jgi:NADPH:quinone reductase-like Zn-dependent oxidoreductase